MRRTTLYSALVWLVAALPLAAQRPNIVLLYSDDHAAHAVSAYRQHLPYAIELPATRNIDRLAREGMLFRNAFVTNSICTPARAAVLTGQYGHLSGVMTNADTLHPTTTTFPGILREHGYRTAIFGKWHLKDLPTAFDRFELLPGQGAYYNPTLLTGTDTLRFTGYTQEVITGRALAWVRDRTAEAAPFFVMVALNAPHRFWDPGPAQLPLYRGTTFPEPSTLFDDGRGRAFPNDSAQMMVALDLNERDLKLDPPTNLTAEQRAEWDRWYEPENSAFRSATLAGPDLVRWKYQRYIQDYMRAVQGVDAAVGQVLAELDRLGIADNTIVIYSSDQGFFLGDHGWFDKRWMYEESLRTPLIVRWPGTVRPGSVNQDLVMNLDFAPTLLEIAGVQPPAAMQGASFVNQLRGRRARAWRDAIYYQYFAYPDWHMVQRQYGVRDHRYKLIHYYEHDRWELFDLQRDPHELRSVYGQPQYARVTRDLKRKLEELRRQYDAPAEDPVPHRHFELPPEYRRRGG